MTLAVANEISGPQSFVSPLDIQSASELPSVDVRFCEGCGRALPMHRFRPRVKGGAKRMSRCNDCHTEKERIRKSLKYRKDRRRKLVKCLTQLGNETDLNRLALMCRVMVREFGGTEKFLATWLETYEHSAPGSFTRFRCLKPVLSIMQAAADAREKQRQESASRYPSMSDEELAAMLGEQLRALIAEQPELAVRAAAELGWTVIPPGGEDYDEDAETLAQPA